jgi:hypothetical protein
MTKKLLPFFLLLATVTAGVKSTAQDMENPGTYMTAVSNAHLEMNQKYMAYVSAVAHGSRARKVEKLRNQTLESITNSKYKTSDLPYYKGDNSLRQSSIDYIQLCYKIFSDDYAHIVNMEEIAEQSFDEMQAYLLLQEKTNEKLKEASDNMQAASKAFAAKYNVQLIEGKSELGDKMEAAGKLNHYNHQVFLIFFKCNWQNGELDKALKNKKLNDVEQARNSLIRYADEGFKGLDTLKTFEGDPALANACRQVLNFYKKMAENDVPKITDFFLKQENFEKIKKTMESKGNSRTKEDVEAYNKTVEEINKASAAYNQVNEKIYNENVAAVNNWNETDKNFSDVHMPHYK